MTTPQDPAVPHDAASAAESTVDSASASAPEGTPAAAPAPQASERPRPAFGEYAPEGWSWQPPVAEASATGQDPAGATATPGAPQSEIPGPQFGANIAGGVPSGAAPGVSPGIPKTVAGVPHNLGVGQARQGNTQHFTPPATPSASPHEAAPKGSAGEPFPPAVPAKRRRGDRITTIALLVLGAVGALNSAAAFMVLPQSFAMMAETFEIKDWTTPAAIGTIGTVGAFVMLGLFAVVLIYSVQRMRRGKLAFLVPLIGGVIALVLMFVIMGVAMSQAPELFADTSPERMQKLFDMLSQQP